MRHWLRDIAAGAIASVLSTAYCLSYAALIFSGPLEPWLADGIAAAFLSVAIAAAVVAWRSSFPMAVAGPDSSTSAVIASLAAAMASQAAAAGHPTPIEPALFAMGLGTALAGLLLCTLGVMRAGRAIRFVPYPVIGGFLGATGLLMVIGAVHVITDLRTSPETLVRFLDMTVLGKLLAGLGVAAMLRLLLRRAQDAWALLVVLLVAGTAMHGVLAVGGIPLADARAAGWLFDSLPGGVMHAPWRFQFDAIPWSTLPHLVGDLVAVMFVTAVTLLINATGLELVTKRTANLEREFNAVGLGNLASAALGGFASCISLSRTALNHRAGASGRLSGLTVAVVSGVLLLADPAFLGYVPKFVLGGLLFFAGGHLVHRWLIRSARQVLLPDYLSLLAIAVIIVNWGFIAGVVIGIVIGCATFALSSSRVNAIKFSFDGSEYRSLLDRNAAELALLAEHGRAIQGMTLQSYLFFGSANRLCEHVRVLLDARPECRFLLFDFNLVTGIDSSATHSFLQIKEAAGDHGATLVLVNLSPKLERAFRLADLTTHDVILAPTLDRALERCEQAVIEMYAADGADSPLLRDWLAEALDDRKAGERLAEMCHRERVPAGGIVARQGEVSDRMHFILEGRVSVLVDAEDGRTHRVRSLGRRTTVGEMGLITGARRNATIRAEVDSVLYELTLDAYRRIEREDPALAQALLRYVIAVMSERLSFANRLIGVLQR